MPDRDIGKYSPAAIVSFCFEHPEYLANLLRRVRPGGSYRATFYSLLLRQKRFADEGAGPWGSYYEFGVGGGNTLASFVRAFRDFERTQGPVQETFRIFAFDSFKGLPAPTSTRDQHPGWKQGSFAHTLDEVRGRIARERLNLEHLGIRFIEGAYEESLTRSLQDELADFPPALVMIDVDFYSSTRTVLEWLRPLLRTGTLLYFDDVWGYRGDPEKGELAAIDQFNHQGRDRLVNYPVEAGMHLVSPRFVFIRRDDGARHDPR